MEESRKEKEAGEEDKVLSPLKDELLNGEEASDPEPDAGNEEELPEQDPQPEDLNDLPDAPAGDEVVEDAPSADDTQDEVAEDPIINEDEAELPLPNLGSNEKTWGPPLKDNVVKEKPKATVLGQNEKTWGPPLASKKHPVVLYALTVC